MRITREVILRKERINLPKGYQSHLLTVLEDLGNKNGRSNYLCKCSCGNTTEVLGKHIVSKNTKSCGCLVPMISMAHCASDEKCIIGNKYGRLEVIMRDHMRMNEDSHSSFWICKCQCGKEKSIKKTHLLLGTKSCGCLGKETKQKFFNTYCVKRVFYTQETLKKCSRCKKVKKCSEFFKQLDKFTSHCKDCYREKSMEKKELYEMDKS